ncbi:MAG: tetratricopeptide repeat protein, partial [Polyangiales bacterium]
MNSRSSRPPRSIRSRAGALQAPRGGWRDALTALGLCAGLAVGSSAVPTAKVQAEASPGAGADAAARGRALLRAGQLKDAEAQLKKAAEQRGHNLESLYDLARVHFAAGDYNKSRNACRPLLSKAPDAAYSNLCMAQAFLVFRRATRAAEHVDKARQAEPQLPEVYQVLGDLKRVEGDAAASEAAYQQVLRSRPSDPDAHFGLGQLYLIKPDPAAATQAFRAALSGAPDWPEAQYELGRLVGGSEAVGLLRRVVASRPEWVEARLALGEALLATGDVAQAEPLFREVLKRSPNLPAAHARLGMVLQVRGDLVHAEAELKRGLTGLPNDADASLALARVYAQSDRPD